jgi:hypothetical protein
MSAGGVAAQSIAMVRGRVLRADSVTPAANVVVTAVDAKGATAARGITGPNGDYVLQLRAGTYEVRALRIGFRPTVVRGVAVEAGKPRFLNVVLTALPVALTEVAVRGSGDCALKGKDAATYLRLWEQARGALTATSLWEQSGALDVQVVRVEGREDSKVDYHVPLYEEIDTSRVRQGIVDRVFAATPAESLLKHGYVRRRDDGKQIFDMPSAEAFLSDGFIESHCFSIEKNSEHPDWVGLGFRPRRTPKGITDIKGVLWMERESAELRRLEFDYVNVTLDEYQICDHHPFIPLTPAMIQEVPPFEQMKRPFCSTINARYTRYLNLGGHADFARLGGGEWLVSRWRLRTPPDTARARLMPWRTKLDEFKKPVRCYYGPDCKHLKTLRPRLVTVEGMVTRVVRDGVELFSDTVGRSLVDSMLSKRAGDRPSALHGVVRDAEGRPVANAVVQVEEPHLEMFTEQGGEFSFHRLPPGRRVVSVRCRGYAPLRFSVALAPDSAHRASLALTKDAPQPERRTC